MPNAPFYAQPGQPEAKWWHTLASFAVLFIAALFSLAVLAALVWIVWRAWVYILIAVSFIAVVLVSISAVVGFARRIRAWLR